MISKKYNFIFMHIIRTGGVSVEDYLFSHHRKRISVKPIIGRVHGKRIRGKWATDVSDIGCQAKWFHEWARRSHITAEQYRKFLKRKGGRHMWDNFYKFAFVRNPWDFMVSLFFHFQRLDEVSAPPRSRDVSWKKWVGSSFTEWVKKFLDPDQSFIKEDDVHLLTQAEWLSDKEGNLLIDFVGKFENLQEDFIKVCDKLNVPVGTLPHKNGTKHNKYVDYYDEETKELVAESFKKDIKIFDYNFGD